MIFLKKLPRKAGFFTKKDKESSWPDDWRHKGSLDIRRAEILLEHDDPEGAAFHLQQTVEKYLKGYLIQKGWKLKRIHDLEELLDYAVDYNTELESFRELCQEITEYYIEERYPLQFSSKLTPDEIRSKLEEVRELIKKLA